MRVLIAGPGAVGCMFAGRLSDAGADVWLMAGEPGARDRLAKAGIHIERAAGTFACRPRVVLCAGDRRPPGAGPDVALVTVKAYDTGAAGAAVAAMFGRDLPVVSLQNGIGNAEVLAGDCGFRDVICATTSCGATRIEPGRVREAGVGLTVLAPVHPPLPDAVTQWAGLLAAAELPVECRDDAQQVVWSKAVINAAVNALSALAGQPNGALVERADLLATLRAAAREGQQVAEALGIRLTYSDAAAEAERVCRQTASNLSSMLQDVRAGRQTEVRQINGAIVNAARRAGIPTPVNDDLLHRVLADHDGCS